MLWPLVSLSYYYSGAHKALFGSKDKGETVMDLLNPYYLQIVMFFIINAIMGISIYFTLASGQLSLGAAGFMSVGAYVGRYPFFES